MWGHREMFAAVAAAALLGGAAPAARADGWIATWGASDVFPVGQDINYQTLRQVVRLSAGGKQVRVRLSNETGHYPLVIGAAHVAKPASGAPIGTIDVRDRPRAHLRRPARGHDRTGRGGALRPGRDRRRAAVDARGQPVRAALDRPFGHPSRRGGDDPDLGRRGLHRGRLDPLAQDLDLALLHQ